MFFSACVFCVLCAFALRCPAAVAGCAELTETRVMKHILCLVVWALLPCDSTAFVPGGGTASFFGHKKSSNFERPRIRQRQSHADGLQHARRTMSSTTMQSEVAEGVGVETEAVDDKRKKVVVVGAGWAGLAAAYELSKQVRQEF